MKSLAHPAFFFLYVHISEELSLRRRTDRYFGLLPAVRDESLSHCNQTNATSLTPSQSGCFDLYLSLNCCVLNSTKGDQHQGSVQTD